MAMSEPAVLPDLRREEEKVHGVPQAPAPTAQNGGEDGGLTIQQIQVLYDEIQHLKIDNESLRSKIPAMNLVKPVRVVLLGLGRMGDIRLSAMLQHSDVDIVAFVDAAVERGKAYSLKYGRPHFRSTQDMLDALGSEVNAVWICFPTAAHKDAIVKVANAGMHIAVEKPVCATNAETQECYDYCKKKGVSLHCSFQRRFDPSYQRLAEAVRAGSCGDRLASIRTVFRDHPCPNIEFLKTGGDIFHDLAVHDIDFVRSIVVNEEPCDVWAHGCSTCEELRVCGVLDTAVITMRYPSGLTVCLDLSRHSMYGYDQRIEVFGTNGRMISVENQPSTAMVESSDTGATSSTLVTSFPQRFSAAYILELDNFVESIKNPDHVRPCVQKKDAALATVIAEAARQSALAHSVVHLTYAADGESATFSVKSRL